MALVPLLKPTKVSDLTADWCIRSTVNVEAGYVNNPNDAGGETKCGVTYATANEHKAELVAKFGWSGRMVDITPEMAMYLFKKYWWDKLACDDLLKVHPFIAHRVFDFGINAGRSAGALRLQRILNVMNRQGKDYADIAVDGAIAPGGQTVRALQALVAKRGNVGVENVIQLLVDSQGWYYVETAEKRVQNEEFMNGWATRVREANELYQSLLNSVS